MKWVYTIVRRWYVVVVAMYSLLLGNPEPIPLSFDSCYVQSSWYKKVLDSCMQAWYAAEALHEHRSHNMSEDERTLYINMLMGRLTFASFCLAQCIKTEQTIMSDELDYLEQVLEQITKQCTTLAAQCAEHKSCAQQLIQIMVQKLRNIE
jgi:hypothetical protein